MFRYGKFFRVLEIADETADAEQLQQILGVGKAGSEPAAERLHELVVSTCKSVIVEDEYIDLDYRTDFARLHYLRHFDTPRRCTRLHFFATRLRPQHFVKMPNRVKGEHLGFAVLRPFEGFRIGRSILSPRLMTERTDLGENYVTCTTTYPVSIAGNMITVDGTPYMQQDTLVSACASASVWTAAWHMAHRFSPEFRAHFSSEITDLATRYVLVGGRPMPSEGLSNEQMLCAFREMRFDPLIFDPSLSHQMEALRNVIYRYVESQIPVILSLLFPGVGGHAVTLVGHTRNISKEPETRELRLGEAGSLRFCSTSEFATSFVCQDDSGGPFRYVELLTADEAVVRGFISTEDAQDLTFPVAVLDAGSECQQVALVRAALVPLPPAVTLRGYWAERRALWFLALWRLALANGGEAPPAPTIVLRTFLQLSNEMKESFSRCWNRRLANNVRRHLFSRWVWVTEISELDSLRTHDLVLGQVVQDCAGHRHLTTTEDIQAINLPPMVTLAYPSGKLKVVPITDYAAYPQFRRPA